MNPDKGEKTMERSVRRNGMLGLIPLTGRTAAAVLVAAAAGAWTASGFGCAASSTVAMVGKPSGRLTMPLKGVYRATVHSSFAGSLSGLMTAEPLLDDERDVRAGRANSAHQAIGFAANTRQGVAWRLIGGLTGFFGPLFAPSIFPDGVIVTWKSAMPGEGKDGNPGDGWISVGSMRGIGVRTRMKSPDEPVQVLLPDGRCVAIITLEPANAATESVTDYPALARSVGQTVRTRLFDREVGQSEPVASYLSRLEGTGRIARDDLEFIFGAVVAGRDAVKFPVPLLYRHLDPAMREKVARLTGDAPKSVHVAFDEKTGIATLKPDVLLDVEEVDQAMAAVADRDPAGLIIDLRQTPGLDLSALRIAAWLISEPVRVCRLFDAEHRDEVLSGKVGQLPHVDLGEPETYAPAEAAIEAAGMADVVLAPSPVRYDGPVAVLISRRTSATSEMLVWALERATAGPAGRVRVIGQPTAGRPLLGRPIDVGQGWILRLAVLDSVMFREDGVQQSVTDRGVPPQAEARGDAAVREAERWIRQRARGGEGGA